MTAPTSKINPNVGPVQRTQGSISGTYTAATNVSATQNATMAAGVLTLTLGFVPTYFKLQNVTTGIMREWFAGMTAGTSLDTTAAGVMSLNASSGVVIALETRAGAVGGTSSGGSADTSPSGVCVVTASGIFTNNDTVAWYAIG